MGAPDVYDLWEQHEADKQRELERLPVCDYCDEHIQDDFYYEINGDVICECCMNDYFRKMVDV